MEKIQVIQPTKLLAPYIKQYWFLRIDDVKQGNHSIFRLDISC